MELDTRRAMLVARRDAILGDLDRIRGELGAAHPGTRDWAGNLDDDQVFQALGNPGGIELRRIGAALRRIDSGDYSYCKTCGEVIAPDRLDSMPDTAFCTSCAPNGA